MALDQQYIRRYRQHIPFYKSNFPQEDRRVYWHHRRCLCDPDCIFGIPVVENQYLMFAVEDDAPTDIELIFSGASQNSTMYSCCLDEGDADSCEEWTLAPVQEQTFNEHRICVIDGAPIQFNYMRIKIPNNVDCGLKYIKIVAYEGTVNERVFYSEPISIYSTSEALVQKLAKLNINDSCGIGGISWSKIWQGWSSIDGYEVYLPELSAVSFSEEVTDEEVEEDGKGNEIQIFKKVDTRYQFDTRYVPDHYAEIIKELEMTDNNAVTIPDNQASHYVEISRAVSTYTADNDGCFMNVNMSFNINAYSKDSCCDIDQCECPADIAIQAISYTTDEAVADAVPPEVGDIYIIPAVALIGTNPNWNGNENRIATWTGSAWTFANNTIRSYAYIADTSDYWISRGVGNVWNQSDGFIENILVVGGGTCTITVTGVGPVTTWWKIQIEVNGTGIWNDIDGVYHDTADWINGIDFQVSFPNNYNARLVPLDTGCGLDISPIENFLTTDNCA